MNNSFTKYGEFNKKIVIIGFGSLGQAILPLLFRHLEISPSQVLILTENDDHIQLANQFEVSLTAVKITPENYMDVIGKHLEAGDFLLNLSVNISSIDLIKFSQQKGALYLDTCTEPWDGVYTDESLSSASRTNYYMRNTVLKLKGEGKPTAVITHGANPGLVSHFFKQALCDMAKDNGYGNVAPHSAKEWAKLAKDLGIKSIHIAESDSQTSEKRKAPGEFVNTWSIDGLISEGNQPAELGWGTHERHWPLDGHQHSSGSKSAIYLERPGAMTKVRTWTPLSGPVHGYLITHAESISIADYLTLTEDNEPVYRPTVHYAYAPCPDAVVSLHELVGKEWSGYEKQRLLRNEIVDGIDALGVLLMGNEKGAYWFGSQLSIQEARGLAPNNNATTMQVVAGALSGLIWAIKNPNKGVVEPEDMDYEVVMEIAKPYLGLVDGYYTDWTPLQNREKLFKEHLDHNDPWQFLNIRVV